MRSKLIKYLPLVFIILFSSFLYFYKIKSIPNGVYSDEATVGYNAFSILNTGKDEYGKAFPLAFRFFGSYTPPLYIYLTAPLIKVFGLNEFSLRLLSGLSTLGGILIIYLFAKSLKLFKSSVTPTLISLLFAISPWVVFNARLGYEVTLGYILFALGALFLWRGISHKYLSYTGLTILSISTYAAHTERFLAPIFLVAIILLFGKDIRSFINLNKFKSALVILVITQTPNLYLLTTKAFWVKNTVFAGVKISQIFIDFTSQYLTYLSPSEIFGISKDNNLQHTIPLLSPFYSWLIIPFFIGLYSLYLKKHTTAGKYLLALLFTAPLPGALSGHFISIQRILPIIIPVVLIIGLGLDHLVAKIRKRLFIPVFVLLILLSLLLLWRSYFVLLPQERATWWSYGYRQLADITDQNPDTLYVFDNARLPPAYMSILYHLKYPPEEFQKNFAPAFVNDYYSNPPYNPNYKIANIDIRSIVWETDTLQDQILIGDTLSISEDQAREHFLNKVIDIKDPLGNSVFVGFRTNPSKKIADNTRKKAILNSVKTRGKID